MTERRYHDSEVGLWLALGATSVRVRLEHKSGAALIVPDVPLTPIEGGATAALTTFDGIHITLAIFHDHLTISASGPSALLGGALGRNLTRGPDILGNNPVRVTGDEATMPIQVDS